MTTLATFLEIRLSLELSASTGRRPRPLPVAGKAMATIEQARAAISHFRAAAGMQKGANPGSTLVEGRIVR